MKKIKIVSEINNLQELDELKAILKIYVVSNRIKEIVQNT
jgi:hypothetical protein